MIEKKKYRIGMYGVGTIARKIDKALGAISDRIVRYGAASRDYKHAHDFCKNHGFKVAYRSYEEMLDDPKIDVVYISTPTERHYSDIRNSLLKGKHVIAEKPFVMTSAEAEELFDLAIKKGLVLIDAMWSMYMPIWDDIENCIKSEDFGGFESVKSVFASLGYPKSSPNRIIYDLEIYCIAAVLKLFKTPISIKQSRFKKINSEVVDNYLKAKTGSVNIKIRSSIRFRTSYLLVIRGKKGMIFSRRFWFGRGFVFWKYPFKIKRYDYNHEINGYEYELREMLNVLDENTSESKVYPHSETIRVMNCIDSIRMLCE